jgi:hypothetical protein
VESLWEKEETGLQRREKGSRWLSVVGWWLTVMELVVEKLVMRLVVVEATEREREIAETGAVGAGFFQILDPIFFPPSGHQISLYL